MVILLYAHPVRAIRHRSLLCCYADMLLLALLGSTSSTQSHNEEELKKFTKKIPK